MKLYLACLVAGMSMCAQAQVYPAAIATDADLPRAANNINTRLRISTTAGATTLYVQDATGMVVNMLLTVDPGTSRNEIVRVTAISDTALTVVRAQDGSTAAAHNQGASVVGYVVAKHLNALANEVKSIESTLGVGLSNVTVPTGAIWSTRYNFAAQQPGGSLTATIINVVTLTPCPVGLNGTDTLHRVLISGGTGTTETVLISGGTCTSGAATGTITFTPAYAHSGAWRVSSAAAGIPEALQVAKTAGSGLVYVPAGSTTVYPDSIVVPQFVTLQGAGPAATVLALTGTGTTGVYLYSPDNYHAGLRDIQVDARSATVTNGVLVTGVMTGLLRSFRIFGATNGLRFGANSKFNYVEDALIQYQSNCGFLSDTNSSAENHFTDVEFGGSPTQTGFCVSRTTNDDIGGYWFNRVKVGGGGVVPTGLSFTSTVANTPFILNSVSSTFDSIYGNGWVLTNAQNVTCDGCWFSSVRSGYSTVKITDGSIFNFANSTSLYAAAAPIFELLSPTPTANSPSTFRAYNNQMVDLPGGPTCVFKAGASVSPADFGWGLNRTYTIPWACSGSESQMAAATNSFQHYMSPHMVYTNPAGNSNAKFGLFDPLTNTAKFLHVNNSALEFVNNALSTNIMRLDDNGNLETLGSVSPGAKTFSVLGSPVNGRIYYCSDCTVTSGSNNVCAGSGTGALAVRLNSVWRCFNAQN